MRLVFLSLAAFCFAISANAEMLRPSFVEDLRVTCSFGESCFARTTYLDNKKCQKVQSQISIWTTTADGRAQMKRPNGSTVEGILLKYIKFENVPYLFFSASDGSGASLVTIFPDMSAVWTGHFMLQENVAYSHFGTCEETT
ncbi:MAG: hypothetical protein GY945_13405 [Rhodobacteraceae bacterium]|nr:hypothetical protein [Paracoccaceae bacterium]